MALFAAHGRTDAQIWANTAVRAACTASRVAQEIKRFVYVLHSVAHPERQFVESASNVSMRIAAHNAGHSPLTAAHRPWRLVAVFQFGNETVAQRFEKFLKSGPGRAFSKHHFT